MAQRPTVSKWHESRRWFNSDVHMDKSIDPFGSWQGVKLRVTVYTQMRNEGGGLYHMWGHYGQAVAQLSFPIFFLFCLSLVRSLFFDWVCRPWWHKHADATAPLTTPPTSPTISPSLFNSIFIFPKTNSKFKGKNVGGKNSGLISDLVYFVTFAYRFGKTPDEPSQSEGDHRVNKINAYTYAEGGKSDTRSMSITSISSFFPFFSHT